MVRVALTCSFCYRCSLNNNLLSVVLQEHHRHPTKVSMWRLAARVILGTKVHPVTRRLLAGAAKLQCCWWGTARRTHTGYMSAGIRKVEAPDAEHLVRVQWEDGSESCYPCVWLRDNCQCPHCFLHSAKARKLLFEDLDVDIVAKEVTLTDRRKVRMMILIHRKDTVESITQRSALAQLLYLSICVSVCS